MCYGNACVHEFYDLVSVNFEWPQGDKGVLLLRKIPKMDHLQTVVKGGGWGGGRAKRWWLPGNNSKTVNLKKGDKNVVSHKKNNKDGVLLNHFKSGGKCFFPEALPTSFFWFFSYKKLLHHLIKRCQEMGLDGPSRGRQGPEFDYVLLGNNGSVPLQ